MKKHHCCLLILNYNGRKHLADCLPSALLAAKTLGSPCAVVVVDNQSTEDDHSYIRMNFPEVEIFSALKNNFCFSLNDAIAQRSEDIVILLNNDMRFDVGFIGPLVEPFQDSEVFAVSAKVFNWDGAQVSTARRIGYFHHFWFYKSWNFEVDKSCYTLDAGAGCAAFNRKMFLELGGLDTLYWPAYWEDTDLSYRAWQRGWKILYEPRSIIYHKIGATIDEIYGQPKRTRLIARNGILFTVKNCGDFLFLFMFLCLLPLRALRNYLGGNRPLASGVLAALPRIPLALKKRFQARHSRQVPDKDFLERIRKNS